MAFAVTGHEIIAGALKLIGAHAEGETLNGEALTDGLSRLNELLDALDTQRQARYALTRSTFAYSPNVGAYTIGPGGAINQVRPDAIERVAYIPTGGTQEISLRLVNPDEYAAISIKGQTAGAPTAVIYEPTAPLGTLTFYPVPTDAATLVLYVRTALSPFADASTSYTLPKGYARMLRYQLAIALAPEYGKSAPPEVVTIAADALADVKRSNTRIPAAKGDPAISGLGGSYDIYSDEIY